MGLEEQNTILIVCDNPACPGNDLDRNDRAGWLFVSHEVYGEPTGQHVFCTATCLSAASGDAAVAEEFGLVRKAPVEEPAPTP